MATVKDLLAVPSAAELEAMVDGPPERKWWHFYGSEFQNDDWYCIDEGAEDIPENRHPCWMTILLGESPLPPDDPRVQQPLEQKLKGGGSWPVPYLTSWDHEPSDEEREAATPASYRDCRFSLETGPDL